MCVRYPVKLIGANGEVTGSQWGEMLLHLCCGPKAIVPGRRPERAGVELDNFVFRPFIMQVKQLIVDYTKLCRFTKKYKKQKKRIFGVRLGLKKFRLGLKNLRFKGLRFSD